MRFVWSVCLASCAINPGGGEAEIPEDAIQLDTAEIEVGPLPWDDSAEVLTLIYCAIKAEHGPQLAAMILAAPVRAVRGFPLNGAYNPATGEIYVDAGAASAKHSALRHEFFAHRLPHILANDVNRDHSRAWEVHESKLNGRLSACARDAAQPAPKEAAR